MNQMMRRQHTPPWKGRNCSHPGCRKLAQTQCGSFAGGNHCAGPLCADHATHRSGVDLCHKHKPAEAIELLPDPAPVIFS